MSFLYWEYVFQWWMLFDSTMPSDSMDDIELKNIQLQFPALRYLTRDDSSVREERIETDKGTLLVAVQGNRGKPAILTYHDLGLNCKLHLHFLSIPGQYNLKIYFWWLLPCDIRWVNIERSTKIYWDLLEKYLCRSPWKKISKQDVCRSFQKNFCRSPKV